MDISTSWNSVPKPLGIEATSCVVHVLNVRASILASTHKVVVASSAFTLARRICTIHTFLVDNCHPVEIVVSQIEVLSSFVFHLVHLIQAILEWKLLDFETLVFVLMVESRRVCSLIVGNILIEVRIGKDNFGVAIVR
jgi:hypothetical protein